MPSLQLIEYAVAARGLTEVSGDLSLVRQEPEGVLIAVADGLGHGPEAAHAASIAIGVLNAISLQPRPALIAGCHAALAETRGVVLAVALIDARSGLMSWSGVGNIEGRLVRHVADGERAGHSLIAAAGIVGHHLPAPHLATIALHQGDLLALATDGIKSSFDEDLRPELTSRQAATRVLARCAKHSDDALILVLRWNGRQ